MTNYYTEINAPDGVSCKDHASLEDAQAFASNWVGYEATVIGKAYYNDYGMYIYILDTEMIEEVFGSVDLWKDLNTD